MAKPILDSLDLLDAKRPLSDGDRALMEDFGFGADIARQLYRAREAAGLTRAQLARKLKIKASVIEDVEETDFEGNPLEILQLAAKVMNLRLEVHVIPAAPVPGKRRKTA